MEGVTHGVGVSGTRVQWGLCGVALGRKVGRWRRGERCKGERGPSGWFTPAEIARRDGNFRMARCAATVWIAVIVGIVGITGWAGRVHDEDEAWVWNGRPG